MLSLAAVVCVVQVATIYLGGSNDAGWWRDNARQFYHSATTYTLAALLVLMSATVAVFTIERSGDISVGLICTGVLLAAIMLSFDAGRSSAIRLVESPFPTHRLLLSNGKSLDVILVRIVSGGVIYVDVSLGRTRFIKMDAIQFVDALH